jgi:methyl-accepting chemotaxis protein
VRFRATFEAVMTLRHAPLWVKVLLTPAIVLCAMLVMAAVAIFNFAEQDASVRRLDTAVFEHLRLAMETRDGVTLFQAGLSDFTSLAANETDDARHKQIADSLVRQADATAASVQKLADRTGDASDGQVDEIARTFKAYRESALPVIDMAQSNASYAVLLMGDVSSQFLKLRRLLEGYVAVREGQRQAVVSELLAGMSAARRNFLLLLIGAAAFSGLAAFFIVRMISRPVVTLTHVMGTLAAGQTDMEVPGCEQQDELGEMARAVQVFKEAMGDAARLQAEREANSERAVRRGQHLSELIGSFEGKVSKILGMVSAAGSEMQTAAATMTGVADGTTRQTDACANAAQQASSNVQAVAAATEQLSASVGEMSRQVAQSTVITRRAVEEAAGTNETVGGLAEAAKKIEEIVDLISGIAGQTNLLALNATIEAARAGDAGKGFAVVASEVKSLAQQTKTATEQISSKIIEMQTATNNVVAAIGGIGATIDEVNQIADTIASGIKEQGSATKVIARNVQAAADGAHEVSNAIEQIAAATATTGGAAEGVSQAARQLSDQSETLRREIDLFLQTVRAA